MNKKLMLASMCLLAASGLYAQNVPEATGKGVRAAKQATKAAASNPVVKQAVEAAVVKAEKQTVEPTLLIGDNRSMSQVAYWYLHDREQFWEPPRRTLADSKMSRHQIEQALYEMGFDPVTMAGMPYTELRELLATKWIFDSVKDVPSRFTPVKNGDPLELQQMRWANQQPDFNKDNYISGAYGESFNTAAKSMRALVAVDDPDGLDRLAAAQKDYPEITLDFVITVEEAQEKLAANTYDIVLADFGLNDGQNGLKLTMWMYEQGIKTPAFLYSTEPMSCYPLYCRNAVGKIPPAKNVADAKTVINYMSNMVATGLAFPNGK